MPRISSGNRIAVTGANGFVGQHVQAELAACGYRVIGIGRDEHPLAPDSLDEYVCADLTTAWPAIPEVAGVVHLAGHSAVGPSFSDPMQYISDNSAMVVHLGEAALRGAAVGRVLVVSSGAVYDATAEQPVSERSPVFPSSPYVVSKLLVENLASYYRARQVDVILARPFNHVGPGQGAGFLVPDLARGLAVARRTGEPLGVGDLGTARDYTDVRDVARAYRLILETDLLSSTTYNVCSGVPRRGDEILAILEQVMGTGEIDKTVDEAKIRPSDPREIRGDSTALTRDTTWAPSIDLVTTIKDYVNLLSVDG